MPREKKLFPAVALLGAAAALMAQNPQPRFRWPDGKQIAVSLSFDDARASQVDVGLPLFAKHGAKVTFYVNPRNAEKRLDGWKRAAAAGHEIGNHSESHPCSGNFSWSRDNALEDYTPARIGKEMDDANTQTERLLGVKPVTFAYPCGQKFIGRGVDTRSYVPLVAKRFLAGRGFRDEAANDPVFCDLAQIFGVDSDGLSFEEMKQLVADAAKEGRWLVFAGHDIGSPGHQVTQAAVLDQFLRYTADPANGVWLDTVAAVARYIQEHRK